MSVFCSFRYFLFHPICSIVACLSLCPLTSSYFPLDTQFLSILLPDLIMNVVRVSVVSLESHGRQLPSEVGHMVRWVTRVDSNRPRDGQRDTKALSTLHFINTRQAGRHLRSQHEEETLFMMMCDISISLMKIIMYFLPEF